MDDRHALGPAPRGFGFAHARTQSRTSSRTHTPGRPSTEASQTRPAPAPATSPAGAQARDVRVNAPAPSLAAPGTGDDHDHHGHGHKYSSKNWNQRPYPGSTTQLPLSQSPTHAQSDLVGTPQPAQLDPSQSPSPSLLPSHSSHWPREAVHRQQSLVPSPLSSPPQQQQQQQHVSSSPAQSSSHFHAHRHPHPHPSPYPYQYQHQHQYQHALPSQSHSLNYHSSQPPRLPPLAASLAPIPLSPFDPFNTRDGDSYLLSSSASSTPATSNALFAIPRLPVQPDEIVSPISETRSSTPIFRSLERGDEPTAHSPAAQPLSRFAPATALHRQPTTHSSAGASLLDDKDFERSLGVTRGVEHSAASPSRSTFAAINSAVAHDVAHLTDEKSDDWFRFTAQARHSYPQSEAHSHYTMADAMIGDGTNVPDYPQPPMQRHLQHGGPFTSTVSSFVPLPPIRRTSTFDLLRKKGLVDDYSDSAPSPIEKDSPPVPPVPPIPLMHQMPSGPSDTAQHASHGQLSAGQNASDASPHNSAHVQPQLQPPQQQQQQQQQQTLHPNINPHGQTQPIMSQHPDGHVAVGPTAQPGMPPHQMMMSRAGPPGQQMHAVPSHAMVNGQALPAPGRGQWVPIESYLAQPLNPSNRNRSANGMYSYSEKDEDPLPPHFGGMAVHPSQAHARDASSAVPPTAAPRHTPLFSRNPDAGQAPPSQLATYHAQTGHGRPRDSFDNKGMNVRVDQVSPNEDNSDKPTRGPVPIFSVGHRRNSSSVSAVQQVGADGPLKNLKSRHFFPSVPGLTSTHLKPKSNLGLIKPAPSHEVDKASLQSQRDNATRQTRLSELKGMIKGVGSAKEGVHDDRPMNVEAVYESRHSMQGPPDPVAAPSGFPGAQRHPGPYVPPAPPGTLSPQAQGRPPGSQAPIPSQPAHTGQPMGLSAQSFLNLNRTNASGPQLGQVQQVKGEESGKKGSSGGFFGSLFNKQTHKTKEVKPPSPQIPPPNQLPAQSPRPAGHAPFRPGPTQLPGHQLGPHPMFAGQPPNQPGPPGQSPSPTIPEGQTPPSVETARVGAIRRPSEITVSSQGRSGHPSNTQRPQLTSPQGSQDTFRQQTSPGAPGQRVGQLGPQNGGGMVVPQTSPRVTDDSIPENPQGGNPPAAYRSSPNRKPVGSGPSKVNGTFMTSAVPPVVRSEHPNMPPSSRHAEQPLSSQIPPAQQNSQSGLAGGVKDLRQPSLPSPEPSPVHSQSNRSSASKLQGDQPARDASDLREFGQGLSVHANTLNPHSPRNIPGAGGAPNNFTWGPSGARPSAPTLANPPAGARVQPPRAPSSPVPSMDQGSKLNKFFGAYDGGKTATQPQASKEKSAASKFLSAFKRNSKQNEGSSSQPRPQTSPQMAQAGLAHNDRVAESSSGAAPRQVQLPLKQPGQGRGLIIQQMQAGRGQPGPSSPPAMITQGGRGQVPAPISAGTGPMPPRIQRPALSGKSESEQQYDQVPIPQGYEAVHGYGHGGMLAPSPYNAGRPGHTSIQYAQYPAAAQSGFPSQQWDPRVMSPPPGGFPPGVGPGPAQIMPQGISNNIRYQGSPGHPQLQGQPPNPSPTSHPLPSPSSQSQLSPQRFLSSPALDQPGRLSPQGQGEVSTQFVEDQQPQRSQLSPQSFQQRSSVSSQIQSHGWTSTPQGTHSPGLAPQPNAPASDPVSQPNAQAVSISDSQTSNETQPQSHQAAISTSSHSPQSLQIGPAHQPQQSPVNHVINLAPQIPATLSQAQQEATRQPTQSPSSATTAATGHLRSPDAVRLMSRMSISKQTTGSDASFGSSDKPADRTLTLSPEPPGPHHSPIHQVSEQNLSISVDRANGHARGASEDIYNATPRLQRSTPHGHDQREDLAHENTKYAGSEKGRVGTEVAIGGAAGAGVGGSAGAPASATTVTEDNMSFLDGPDSEADENHATPREEPKEDGYISSPPPPQLPQLPRLAIAHMNMEPEEKILVDQPVELAAVNDDDDGLPRMSATSYPGQEWNPYGAGEFGDWE
ncbi:hypothetical protein F4777DRAFT_164860 [Nemania sp. FL0916]|nr:hypothetical protein F4777DRAFT_164860 [Nemania sp. FL0916]